MVQSGARKKECLRILFWLIPCALLLTAAPSPAAAQFKAWVMAKLPVKGGPIHAPEFRRKYSSRARLCNRGKTVGGAGSRWSAPEHAD